MRSRDVLELVDERLGELPHEAMADVLAVCGGWDSDDEYPERFDDMMVVPDEAYVGAYDEFLADEAALDEAAI